MVMRVCLILEHKFCFCNPMDYLLKYFLPAREKFLQLLFKALAGTDRNGRVQMLTKDRLTFPSFIKIAEHLQHRNGFACVSFNLHWIPDLDYALADHPTVQAGPFGMAELLHEEGAYL